MLWLGLPILCWIKVVRVDILALFLTLEDKFSAFPLSMIIAVGFSNMAFIILRCIPYIPTFFESFLNQKLILNFVKSLFCIWDSNVFFYSSFNVVH